jgi:hypothetical protein
LVSNGCLKNEVDVSGHKKARFALDIAWEVGTARAIGGGKERLEIEGDWGQMKVWKARS